MSDAEGNKAVIDEALTAYLDGELPAAAHERIEAALREDAGLRERLATLEAGGRRIEGLGGTLVAASPRDRLEAMLPGGDPAPRSGRASGSRASWHRRLWHPAWRPAAALAAALLAGIIVGLAAERVVRPPGQGHLEEAEAPGGWRESVAVYVSLYTAEGLGLVPDDAGLQEREIEALTQKVAAPLAAADVDLPELDLVRAQLLQYDDKPLGEILYLDPDSGPMAFCVIRNGAPDADPAAEVRHGLNIVHWNEDGIGYMVAGHASPDAIRERAETLRSRI